GSTSSLVSSSFLGINEDAEPNPPKVDGADHGLALVVPAVNPPKRGLAEGVLVELVVVSFDSSFLGVSTVNVPKILVGFSGTVPVSLVAASFTASRGV